MDRLEKLSPPPHRLISLQAFLEDIVNEATDDVILARLTDKAVLQPVYQHWVSRRQKMGNALLRRLATPTKLSNKDLTYSFRPVRREVTRRQLKVNQFWHMERISLLKHSLEHLRRLLEEVKKREKTKHKYIKTSNKHQLHTLFLMQRKKEVEISSSEFPHWMFSNSGQSKLQGSQMSTSTRSLSQYSGTGSTIVLGRKQQDDSADEDSNKVDTIMKKRFKTRIVPDEPSAADSPFGSESEDGPFEKPAHDQTRRQRKSGDSSRRRDRNRQAERAKVSVQQQSSGDDEESMSNVDLDTLMEQTKPQIEINTKDLEEFDVMKEGVSYLSRIRALAATMINNWQDLNPFTVEDKHSKENQLYDSESEMVWSSAEADSDISQADCENKEWDAEAIQMGREMVPKELMDIVQSFFTDKPAQEDGVEEEGMLRDPAQIEDIPDDEGRNRGIVSFLLNCYGSGREELETEKEEQRVGEERRKKVLTENVVARITEKRQIQPVVHDTTSPLSFDSHLIADTTTNLAPFIQIPIMPNANTDTELSTSTPSLPTNTNTSDLPSTQPTLPPSTLDPPADPSPAINEIDDDADNTSDDFLNSDEECAAISMGLLTPFDVYLLRRRRTFFRRAESLVKEKERMAEASASVMLVDKEEEDPGPTAEERETMVWLLEREKRRNEVLDELRLREKEKESAKKDRSAQLDSKNKEDTQTRKSSIQDLIGMLESSTIDPLLCSLNDDEQLSLLTKIPLHLVKQHV
ncbi:hypothetical protein BLNAU_4209 [Blattamonas nauphoetae]|uniref:Fibrous sheath-interacting protein 1 n=1 Tax=Blattamonas nauphoetae TaxID=2049346 RepID=A0ABQ9YAL2_9EUKA|nr:hypothetical protein BLNAU_4209 [Blattamonas nauphoetae]